MKEPKTVDEMFLELSELIKKEDNADIKKLNKRFDELDEKIEPIILWFGHMNWMKAGVLYTAGFIVTIGSAVFTLKNIFTK